MYHKMHLNLGDNFVYIDKRKGECGDYGKIHIYHDAIWEIKPLILADLKFLPFKNGIFSAIIFDPPYLDASLSSFMAKKYGTWNQKETIEHLRAANEEFKRVLKPSGMLILKIFAKNFALYQVLLTNFSFFLPIEYRSQSHLSSEKIGWYIATLKAEPQTVSSLHDTQTQP